MRHRIAGYVALLVATAPAAAENLETLTERSQAEARAVLDRAVEAAGGAQALREVKAVRLTLAGETWPRLQMTTPEPPFEPGRIDETLLLDLEKNRLKLEQKTSGFGFDGDTVIVIADGEGTNVDRRAKTLTPVPAAQASQQQFVQYHRRVPNLILRQALEREASLRHLGEDRYEGRPHEVITFVMADGQQVGLYVDARTNLVSKYELVFIDPLAGGEVSEIRFGDYVQQGRVRVPSTWEWRQAGELVSKYALTVELDPKLDARSFAVPTDGYAKVAPQPTTLEPAVERLADGVYVIRNVAGQNQNTLAVAFEDYVVAVEAPGSSDGADAVIRRIKETIPGKPIRYVAMTHHHGDHIGGLRSFIAEGASVVTTAANRRTVEAMAKAPQNDRLAKAPRAVTFALLEDGRRVISDGKRTLELIDIGPNPHAKEMVIAYLPAEKLVFQGDLFFVPNNDAPFGPPQTSTLAFAKALEERKLAVERIASVHGRTATIAQFREATAAR